MEMDGNELRSLVGWQRDIYGGERRDGWKITKLEKKTLSSDRTVRFSSTIDSRYTYTICIRIIYIYMFKACACLCVYIMKIKYMYKNLSLTIQNDTSIKNTFENLMSTLIQVCMYIPRARLL